MFVINERMIKILIVVWSVMVLFKMVLVFIRLLRFKRYMMLMMVILSM